ncbi:MAG: hypothetical protein WC964_04455 [Acholeplasmataceae bacterium]
MKKKKTLFLLYVLLLVVMLLLVQQVGAWLMDEYQTKSYRFESGEVRYVLTGDLIDSSLIMPAQELLLAPLELTNESSVTTEIRFQIIVTSSVAGIDSQIAIFEFGEGWVLDDGYYYYRGTHTTLVGGRYQLDPDNQTITVLSSYKLNGNIVKNNYRNALITTTLVFQSKQSKYVTWEYLGTANYDFTTGEPHD